MPKVLRIINRFNLGGPTYNAVYLTKYLAPEFETLLLGGNKDESEESSEHIVRQLGLEPKYIPNMYRSLHPLKDVHAFNYLKKTIHEFKPDIVHTHAAKAGALGRIAAIQCDVPVIVHTFHGHVFHSYFNPIKTRFFIAIEKELAKRTTKIIAVSEKQKQELGNVFRICPLEKIAVIPLGFDLTKFQTQQNEKREKFREKYWIDEDEIAIGIIGRIVPIKNHALFLKVLKAVVERTNKKIRAFIVGDGEDRMKIERMATELGLDWTADNKNKKKSVLTFTSWVKEIDEVNLGLDLVAMTSLNEGTPVSLIEAQAANRPIVSTNVGGVEDVVIPNITALLSSTDNVDEMTKNILKLTENDNERRSMGTQGYNFVRDKFDYKRLAGDMRNLYWQLLNKKEKEL